MKKIIIGVLIVVAFLFLILKGLEWWIEMNFEAEINSNPDRAYNITYSDLDLDSFFKGITLLHVRIEPINIQKGTIVRGHVDYATFNGLVLSDLLFNKRLNINEIAFEQPKFEVTLSPDTIKKTRRGGLQSMFGDILSRASINNFRIANGSVVLIDPISQMVKAQVKKLDLLATDLDTDSLKLQNIIPFEMVDLKVDIDSISFELNDYTHLQLGRFQYRLRDKIILLNNTSLGYSIDWIEVSKRLGFQNDIVELNVKEIGIHQFEPSNNFYTQLDIVAQKLTVDELNIKLQRNKNIPRPPDLVKPIFQELINAIPRAFLIDTVQISNSSVTYSELGLKKSESGSIKIQEINGNITGLTNMPEQQNTMNQIDARIDARLFGKAPINVSLQIPYKSEMFLLTADIGEMELKNLNPTLKPLAGMEIVSGYMRRIRFQMNAGRYQSRNRLIFDYDNLKVKLIREKSSDKKKKKVFLSAIVNGFLRTDNLPDQRKYLIAEYQSERNVYRSPINYIIQGLIQGFKQIIPGKFAQALIVSDKKKKNK